MQYADPVRVKVWGERACFTRPEMKMERVSYPVMTPSAARGVMEAIFWKPEFVWRIRSIEVLQPVRWFSMLRNEVDQKMSSRSDGLEAAACRTQRHTLGLREVGYIIAADVQLRPGVPEDPAKYRAQFRRRVERGSCFQQPYLGCREFAAYFSRPAGEEAPVDLNEQFGPMLLDIEHAPDGRATPRFFLAEVEHGVMRVPEVDFNLEGGGHVPAGVGKGR